MFGGYIIAGAAVFFALGRERWNFIKNIFPLPYSVLLSAIAFVCGAAPLIWFNVRHEFMTVRLIFLRMLRFDPGEQCCNGIVDCMMILQNLLQRRVHDFYLYLSGESSFIIFGAPFSIVYVPFFICAFVWGCVTIFGRLGDARLRLSLRMLFVFYFVVLFLTFFVPTGFHYGHMLLLVPFAEILCALFLVHIATRVRCLLFVSLLVCGLWLNEQVTHSYLFSHKYITDGKAYGLLKGDYESLLAWLKSKKAESVMCPDPVGSILNVMNEQYGNKRDMEFIDLWDYSEDDLDFVGVAEKISVLANDPNGYLLCSREKPDYFESIRACAARHGMTVKIVDSKILRNNPACAFLLCRVLPKEEKS